MEKRRINVIFTLLFACVLMMFSGSVALAAPAAQNDTITVNQNSDVVVDVLANDSGDKPYITSVSAPSNGIAAITNKFEVVTVNSSTHPPVPSGLVTWGTVPILKWNGFEYWAYSYTDNRVGMNIVAYDANKNIVKQFDKSGDRYISSIYIDAAAEKVYFRGQYYNSGYGQGIVLTFDELKMVPDPFVQIVDSYTHPSAPSGLVTWGTVPVLKWNGIEYWAYSYIDNRVGMNIIAYDANRNIVKQFERSGDRYISSIYVDTAAKKVYFRGQYYNSGYGQGIVLTLDELNVSYVQKIKYTPNLNFFGTDTFMYTVIDSTGASAAATVTVTVIDKTPPVITVLPYNTSPTNQDVVVYVEVNEGVLNAGSHVFTENGSFTFTATDSAGNTASKTVTVNNINRSSVLNSIGDKSVDEGQLLQFTISATDPEGDQLSFSAPTNLPAGAAFEPATGIFSWTPDYTQSGSYNVRFAVTDGVSTVGEDITITVGNINLPPVLSPIGNKTVEEGKLIQFTINASEPDNNPLTFIPPSNLPAGAVFDTATGTFSWTPDYTQSGTYSGIQFSVTDGELTTNEDITIIVNNAEPNQYIDDLKTYIIDLELKAGVDKSLLTKMDNALKSFANKNVKASVNELKALVNQIEAQRGKSVTEEQADSIIEEIEKVILIINS